MTEYAEEKRVFIDHIDKMLDKYPALMTQEDVATAMNVTLRTLQRWRKEKKNLSFMIRINICLYNKAELRDQLINGIMIPKR